MQNDNKEKTPVRKCEECCTGKHKCFVCDEHTNEVIKCCEKKCGKFYHLKCLIDQHYPLKILDEAKNKFRCPLHFCLTCYNEHREDSIVRTVKKKLLCCVYCPTAYHFLDSCIAAGSVSINNDQLVCPEHNETPTDSITASSKKKKKKKKKSKHVNISWCFSCSLGGELVCCEKCPAAYHRDCIIEDEGKPPNEDHYYCMDCVNRKQLHYDDIIWVKLGGFRWWPAQIKHPVNVPDTILRRDFSNGEFPVLFFGTNDYYWINRSKAFLYMEGDDKKKITHGNVLDKQFKRAMDEVVVEYENWKQNKLKIFQSKTVLPTPYFHLKVNKPFGKCQQAFVDMDKSNKQSCDCKEEDPCTSDENCLNRLLMYECDSAICRNQDKCKNQRFKKREYAKTEKFRSQAGWGLRSLEDIKKGQFVIEYVGELIDEEECNKRLKEMVVSNDKNFYFLTIDKETIIDAGPKGNLARFMNHSCDPNCETQKWVVNNQIRVGLFALRDIPKGSELTFNYNLECRGNEKTKCLCNSKNCSGFIGDRPNKIVEEKQQKETTKKRKAPSKPDYAAIHEDECFRCGHPGKLVMCDAKENGSYCPRSYCLPCLNLEKIPHGKWICPVHHCDICGKKATRFCNHCPTSFCNQHDNMELRSLSNGELICTDHSDEYYNDAKSKASKKKVTDSETSKSARKDSQIKFDENSGRVIKKPKRSNVSQQKEEVEELKKMDKERKRLNSESREKRMERRKSIMQQNSIESKEEEKGEKNLDKLNDKDDHVEEMNVDNSDDISLKVTETNLETSNLNNSVDKQTNGKAIGSSNEDVNKLINDKPVNDRSTDLNSSPKKDKELIVKDKKSVEYSQKENLDKDLPVAKVLNDELITDESNESFLSVKANSLNPQQPNGKILDEQPTAVVNGSVVNGTTGKQLNNNNENENHNHKVATAQSLINNNSELNETAS